MRSARGTARERETTPGTPGADSGRDRWEPEPATTSPRRPAPAPSATAKLLVALSLGCVCAYLCRVWAEPNASVEDHRHSPSTAGSDRAVSLLLLLDLHQYVPFARRRRLTFSAIVRSSPDRPPQGFQPEHWRRLVTQARRRVDFAKSLGGPTGVAELDTQQEQEQQQQQGGLSETQETDRLRGGGSAASEAAATPPPHAARQAHAHEEEGTDEEEGDDIVPSKQHASAAAPSSSTASTPSATLPPMRRERPVVCESMHRSEVLRQQYFARVGVPRPAFNVTGASAVPPLCRRYFNSIDGEPTDPDSVPGGSRWGLHAEHLEKEMPLRAAAADKRFVRQGVTKEQLEALRHRGVVEQMYVDHELKLLYCVVPKAGCTTFKAWLLNNAGLFTGSSVHNRQLYSGERVQNAMYISDSTLLSILNDGEYFKFSYTRSPYTRALATYLERYRNCTKRRSSGECRRWRMALVNQVSEDTFPTEASYKDFLRAIRDTVSPAITFMNAHWLPATRICAFDEIAYDFVGRLEESNDHRLLYNLTGRGKPKSKDKDLRHSEGTASKMKTYYDSEALQTCREAYSNTDEDFLGYVPDGLV